MTPKEKAKELIDKYLDIENYNNLDLDLFCDECGMSFDAAKYCALITVDEIQEAVRYLDDDSEDFWFNVKHEIKDL